MASEKVYEMVTEKLIEALEAGIVPWQKPWVCIGGEMKNLISKKAYRGINPFLLAVAAQTQGFSSPYWLTFKQCSGLGGKVKKGSKSAMIIFWMFLEKENKETGKISKFPMLRYYRVFNTDQCEGLEDKIPASDTKLEEIEPIENAEKIFDDFFNQNPLAPKLTIGGDRACYSQGADTVTVPKREQFKTAEGFYATVYHEAIHSTGHETRLARFGKDAYGSENYSKEELVAEFGSAMLCATAGIEKETIENQAAYIRSWLKALNNDKKMAVLAASKSQKAVDFVLGVTE